MRRKEGPRGGAELVWRRAWEQGLQIANRLAGQPAAVHIVEALPCRPSMSAAEPHQCGTVSVPRPPANSMSNVPGPAGKHRCGPKSGRPYQRPDHSKISLPALPTTLLPAVHAMRGTAPNAPNVPFRSSVQPDSQAGTAPVTVHSSRSSTSAHFPVSPSAKEGAPPLATPLMAAKVPSCRANWWCPPVTAAAWSTPWPSRLSAAALGRALRVESMCLWCTCEGLQVGLGFVGTCWGRQGSL